MKCIFKSRKKQIEVYALKDASGEYGRFLLQRQQAVAGNPSGSIPLHPSTFMESLVNEYIGQCQKKIIRHGRRIKKLVNRIDYRYELFSKAKKEVDAITEKGEFEVNKINNHILTLQKQLDKAIANWALASPTGKVTMDMGVSNLSELDIRIRNLKEQIKAEQNRIIAIQIETEKQVKEHAKVLNKLRSPFNKLLPRLKRAISILFDVIDKEIGPKYDKEMSYYWQILCEKVGISESPHMSFGDMCELCGKSLIINEALFAEDRNHINNDIKSSVGFETTV